MDQEALVTPAIAAGKELLSFLDSEQFEITSALWLLISETQEWRLILASPKVDEVGPRQAFKMLAAKVQQKREIGISLGVISLVSPSDRTVSLFRLMIGTGPGINEIRMTNNSINGVFIEDAVLYRSQ